MVLRKSDLTEEAIQLGLWDALLGIAGVSTESCNPDDAEIEIVKAKRCE